MSMTLILWKAPVVSDEDEAQRLLAPYYDREDDSAFEPSADIGAVAAELLRRFPDAEDGPWADAPPEPTKRILLLSIRWEADDAVLEAIEQLAREHGLVLYDPQGPTVHLPTDPIDSGPTPPVVRRRRRRSRRDLPHRSPASPIRSRRAAGRS